MEKPNSSDDADESADPGTVDRGDADQLDADPDLAAVPSAYKVLGEIDDGDGVGVLGRNVATSGTPVGVQGAVPNASGGYGLYTPDDAKVDGDVATAGDHTVTVDGHRVLSLSGQSGADGGNVVHGHDANAVVDGAVGATVGGGGSDGSSDRTNEVADDYGTVAGGRDNAAGSADGDATTARYATVGGGQSNEASSQSATVGGGANNAATTRSATTVAGGQGNTARSSYATVSGGYGNVSDSYSGSVGGGFGNQATGSNYTTVGGGRENVASQVGSTVAGGVSNATGGSYAAVPGGYDNSADGTYSLAAGRRARASHDGAYVWGDSTDADFASTAADQFLVRAGGGVGIGTDSPASQLHVAGGVTATDYSYETAQTGTLHVPVHEFSLDSTTEDEEWTVTAAGYGYISGGTSGYRVDIHAPVDLPDGVTVTALTGLAYSNTSAGDISLSVSLRRLDTSSISPDVITMAQVSMSSPSMAGAYRRDTDGSVSSPTVANDSYAYYLDGSFSATAINDNLRFYGCKVDYEYAAPGA